MRFWWNEIDNETGLLRWGVSVGRLFVGRTKMPTSWSWVGEGPTIEFGDGKVKR